jgi:hypothetical protein
MNAGRCADLTNWALALPHAVVQGAIKLVLLPLIWNGACPFSLSPGPAWRRKATRLAFEPDEGRQRSTFMKRILVLCALAAMVTIAAPTPADARNWDRIENRYDRAENRLDRRENRWDRREDRRDLREDLRDAQHDGGWRDQREDYWDAREDVRDLREDLRDRREDYWDRRENRWDRRH